MSDDILHTPHWEKQRKRQRDWENREKNWVGIYRYLFYYFPFYLSIYQSVCLPSLCAVSAWLPWLESTGVGTWRDPTVNEGWWWWGGLDGNGWWVLGCCGNSGSCAIPPHHLPPSSFKPQSPSLFSDLLSLRAGKEQRKTSPFKISATAEGRLLFCEWTQ